LKPHNITFSRLWQYRCLAKPCVIMKVINNYDYIYNVIDCDYTASGNCDYDFLRSNRLQLSHACSRPISLECLNLRKVDKYFGLIISFPHQEFPIRSSLSDHMSQDQWLIEWCTDWPTYLHRKLVWVSDWLSNNKLVYKI